MVVAWGMAGLATLVLWAMAVLPADLWVVLIGMQRWEPGWLGPAWAQGPYVVGLLAQDQWQRLSRATLLVVNGLLRLVFSDTICLPDQCIVGTPSFRVGISAECSGYEGVGLIAVFVSIALWMFRRDFRFPQGVRCSCR